MSKTITPSVPSDLEFSFSIRKLKNTNTIKGERMSEGNIVSMKHKIKEKMSESNSKGIVVVSITSESYKI